MTRTRFFRRTKFVLYDVPVPALYKYCLTLIGCPVYGPEEKVLWWIPFTYKGKWCRLALQKFGLRLYLRTGRAEEDAQATQLEIAKRLRSSNETSRTTCRSRRSGTAGQGNATVRNQYWSLRGACEYFRERAGHPVNIEDERTERSEDRDGRLVKWSSFKSGQAEMERNSSYDMIAAVNAFLSLLEHVLVLALAFRDFDPELDNLTDVIGSRWGAKWDRVLGRVGKAANYRQRLLGVVERWRNPYAHGGFEKGHGATIWVHTPGVGAALPIALTRVRESSLYSFSSDGASIRRALVELFGVGELPSSAEESESPIADVFALFDEIEGWLDQEIGDAMAWMRSGLDVRYDVDFRSNLAEARSEADGFERFLEATKHLQARLDNMDF